MKVEVHESFKHDCSDFPEGFDRHIKFLKGVEYDVPDNIGDYFIRAGWASKPGEQPVKPDPTRPVHIQPSNSTLGQSADSL